MPAPWQEGLRPGLVRDLLRPTLLARDPDSGLVGEVCSRGSWPELRLPMLAAWAEQWDRDEDRAPESLPIVHPRPLAPAPAPTTTLVQVQATIIKQAPVAAHAAPPPRVRARTPATGGATTPHATSQATTSPPALPPALVHAPASPPAPATSPSTSPAAARPAEPRADATEEFGPRPDVPSRSRPIAELPRVVAAFRPDLAARPRAPRPDAGEPPLPPDRPRARPLPDLEDMPRATFASPLPGVAPREPAEPPLPPLSHPAARHAAAPVSASVPPASAAAPAALARPLVTATSPDAPTSMSPRTSRPRPADLTDAPPLVHPAAPERSASTSPAGTRLSERPDSAPARPRVTATPLPADVPAPVRPLSPRTALPRAEARWTDGSTPRPAAPTRSPSRRDALPHVPVAAPPGAVDPQRPAPRSARPEQPVPSATPAPQPAAASTPAPQLDIDALVETVERRLARSLGRARELRRALR